MDEEGGAKKRAFDPLTFVWTLNPNVDSQLTTLNA
jgi:hypothetical protein